MKTMNLSFPSAVLARDSHFLSGQNQKTGSNTAPYTPATDTVYFGSSAGGADKEFLENFFQEHPADPNVASNVLAPLTIKEKGQSIALQRYKDELKQGNKPFLPKTYRESLVKVGLLNANNQSWDIERSAFRRYIVEILYKDNSAEERNRALREVGFKTKSKHKKPHKPVPEEVQAEILTPSAKVPPKQKVWELGFDWSEEADSAPAFVEQAKKEAGEANGFAQALRQLMNKNTNSGNR